MVWHRLRHQDVLWMAHSDLSVLEQRILKRATRWISYTKASQPISRLKDTKSYCEKMVKFDQCARSQHTPTLLARFMHAWHTDFCKHLITDSYRNPSVFRCVELQFSDLTHREYPKYWWNKTDGATKNPRGDVTRPLIPNFVDPTRPNNVPGNYFSKCFFFAAEGLWNRKVAACHPMKPAIVCIKAKTSQYSIPLTILNICLNNRCPESWNTCWSQ